jgi:hypothetical protein
MKKRHGLYLVTALVLAAVLVMTGCSNGSTSAEPDTTPPAAVTAVFVSGSGGTDNCWLSWTEPADADFHHVDITGTDLDSAVRVNKGTSFVHLENLTSANVTYTVTAVDRAGNKSAGVESNEFPLAQDSTPPGAVTGAAGAPGSNEGDLVLSWTLPVDTDIASISVGRNDGAGGSIHTVEEKIVDRRAVSVIFTGLDDTVTGYKFKIILTDFAGNMNTGTVTAAAHPLDTTAPEPVSGASAAEDSSTEGDLVIEWTASASGDQNGVILRVYSDSNHETQVGTDVTVVKGTVTKTLTNAGNSLNGNTLYYVRIYAVDYVANESTPVDVSGTSKSG